MSRQPYPDALQALLKRLEASRVRLSVWRLLQSSLWVTLLAASVFLLLEACRYLASAVPWFSFVSEGVVLVATFTVLGLGLVWTLVYTWLTAPSLMAMARRAERQLGLDERLSTALEFGGSGDDAPSSVLKALFQDVAERADQLRPQELVTIFVPRQSWYLGAVIVAALALQLVPPLTSSVTALTPAAPAFEELAETATGVRRAAALIAEDAEQRNDAYLQAVARALEKLGEAIEQQRLSREAVEQELARLVDHLARAYGLEAQVGTDANLADIFAPEASEDAAAADPQAEAGQLLTDEGATVDVETDRVAADAHATLEELVAQLEVAEQGRQQAQATRSAEERGDGVRSYDYTEIDPELQARMDRQREMMARLRAESPVGGDIAEAGQGGGIEPGMDAQALSGEAGNELLPDWAANAEHFELPFDPESSRRIRVELPPEAQLAAIREAQVGGSGWQRHQEVPMAADYLSTVNREMVSRYFSLHQTLGAEERP